MWRPKLYASLQTGTLMAVGDLIAQIGVEGRSLSLNPEQTNSKPSSVVDLTRTARFAGLGLAVGGPVFRTWYGILNKCIGSQGKAVAVKKMIVDQALFAPTFLGIFVGTLSALEGKNFENIKDDLNKNYLDILKANYSIWPAVQLVNFYVIPLKFQVLCVQTVALFWNTYVSWKTHVSDSK